MGLLLPPLFQSIIFCSFLCQPWKCKSLKKASHYSFCKNYPHSLFSPESARALHKSRNRRFTFHQSLYCNTGSGHPECLLSTNVGSPGEHSSERTLFKTILDLTCENGIAFIALNDIGISTHK